MVRNILRLEGLGFFLLALFAYDYYGFDTLPLGWFLFPLLLLIPDISMVGYLINKKLGSITYNLVHQYILVVILFALAFYLDHGGLHLASIILLAHVGMDRFFGFGLKYPDSFKSTHLKKV